ncbi:MAG: DUF1858 domain-containing protein [Planctomycetes bacterium]|nr:DUF1858 domain-containing protein [Planctomycetota bacterium]
MIQASDTIRATLKKHPGVREVLDRYGLLGCGGPEGPEESIEFFAKMHGLSANALVAELNANRHDPSQPRFVSVSPGIVAQGARDASVPAPSGEHYGPFLVSALAAFLVGAGLMGGTDLFLRATSGQWEGGAPAWLAQVHGRVQISGWMTLFIMGVAYHIIPRMAGARLAGVAAAWATLPLAITALLLRVFAQPFSSVPAFQALLLFSALLDLGVAALFAGVIVLTLRSGNAPGGGFLLFLASGLYWLLVAAVINLALTTDLVLHERHHLINSWNPAYWHILLLGFAGMWIFAVSLRFLPHFFGFTPSSEWLLTLAWALVNFGILGIAIGLPAGFPGLAAWSAGMEALGIVSFLLGIGIFRPSEERAVPAPPACRWMLRGAYLWLLLSSLLLLGLEVTRTLHGVASEAMAGAHRHALAVGFMTQMIFGVAFRAVPLFTGQRLAETPLVAATFWLVNLGTATRVLVQPAAESLGRGGLWVLLAAGSLQFLSALTFARVLWLTIRPPRTGGARPQSPPGAFVPLSALKRPTTSTMPAGTPADTPTVRPTMSVGEVVEKFPGTLEVFLGHGFEPLRSPIFQKTVARTVTVATAAKIHGIDLNTLIAELNGATSPRSHPL